MRRQPTTLRELRAFLDRNGYEYDPAYLRQAYSKIGDGWSALQAYFHWPMDPRIYLLLCRIHGSEWAAKGLKERLASGTALSRQSGR